MSKSKTYYNYPPPDEVAAELLADSLWEYGNKMRGHLDISSYKMYFLSIFCYKYISDCSKEDIYKSDLEKTADGNSKQGMDSHQRFVIPHNASFEELKTKGLLVNFGEKINKALGAIEKANIKKLEGLFSFLDFNDPRLFGEGSKATVLVSLFDLFSAVSFKTSMTTNNVTAKCFELLIYKFGELEGKNGFDHGTPDLIAQLLSKLLRTKQGESIYDPACGYGTLLLKLASGIDPTGGINICGHEIAKDIQVMCKMNMIIHGLDNTNITWKDSINNIEFANKFDAINEPKFDIAVSNPPFSLNNWFKEENKYPFFKWGMPPKNKGDYAFIQHLLGSVKEENGRVGVLVSHGVLFRAGAELEIRQNIIQDNLLDAVIALPSNLFFSSGIPVALLLFDKNRINNNYILFVDASKEYVQEKRKKTLSLEGIEKIASVYESYKKKTLKCTADTVEGFCHIASAEEIKSNAYNLSISRYVRERDEIKVNLQELKIEVKMLDVELSKIRSAITDTLNELNLS